MEQKMELNKKVFLLDPGPLQQMANYLQSRPYQEVAGHMDYLAKLRAVLVKEYYVEVEDSNEPSKAE
jgi:hypothetical protein